MECPICGERAYVQHRDVGAKKQVTACNKCADEARRQVREAAAAEVVGPDGQTRAEAVQQVLA